MNRKIPLPVIAIVSDVLASRYTHSRIDYFMEAAGLECLPPPGNKVDKTRAWLKHANATKPDPLATLGTAITELMEVNSSGYASSADLSREREQIMGVLGEHGLSYTRGGYIVPTRSTVISKVLHEIIQKRDLSGLQMEFDRIYENIESDPPSAVTAACALLESLFKIFIEEEGLEMPAEQTIKPLWKVIRKNLNFDPALIEDEDLRTIVVGLAAVVEGTGALRTHKGSAHGRGKKTYRLEPRHARLAAHSAFTLASFVLEAWNKRAS